MEEEGKEFPIRDEVYSRALYAERRTYFLDVKQTRAGDYYMRITESRKFSNQDGSLFYKRHKIYIYKEDFDEFVEHFNEVSKFIIDKKKSEAISNRHKTGFKKHEFNSSSKYLSK